MSETRGHMERPFISYDGVDNNGIRAEVKVTKGEAVVVGREEKTSMITYQFLANKLTKKFHGSVQKSDTKMVEILDKAYKEDSVVYIRKESVRHKEINRSIPASEISNDKFHARIAAVKDENGELIFASNGMALTDPAEDKPTGAVSAREQSAETRGLGSNNASDSSISKFSNSIEMPPYFTSNKDGATNPGSFSVQASASVYYFVAEQLKNADIEADRDSIVAVADDILLGADMLQLVAYKKTDREDRLDSADRSLNSHTRARHLIFEEIKLNHPITSDSVEESKSRGEKNSSWMRGVLSDAKVVYFWAMGLDSEGKAL